MDDVQLLAALINGEAAGSDRDTKIMVGSSALKRLQANKPEEFGSTLQEVAQKGYYAVKNQNELFTQAITGKFPDKKAENAFKESLAIASGLLKGGIEQKDVMFYFKPSEETKMRKKGDKVFNFKAVRSTGKQSEYNLYSY
jgi:spore germination cell wall hydrolase CwlJ-like protein